MSMLGYQAVLPLSASNKHHITSEDNQLVLPWPKWIIVPNSYKKCHYCACDLLWCFALCIPYLTICGQPRPLHFLGEFPKASSFHIDSYRCIWVFLRRVECLTWEWMLPCWFHLCVFQMGTGALLLLFSWKCLGIKVLCMLDVIQNFQQ